MLGTVSELSMSIIPRRLSGIHECCKPVAMFELHLVSQRNVLPRVFAGSELNDVLEYLEFFEEVNLLLRK